MAYYDALKTQWATLTGTTAQKLAAINAMTVAGPNVDVPAHAIVGKMMLAGAYLPLSAFAQTATNGNATHDNALTAAKIFMAVVSTPNAPSFAMSDPESYTLIKGMMDAILAYELTPASPSTGFTQAVHDALLGLCETTVPCWKANGYTSSFGYPDLDAAGGLT